ncbi:MAG: alginate export family protein [Spirochaetia bacterium]
MRRHRLSRMGVLVLVLLLTVSAGTAAAFDFGVTIENATGFVGDPVAQFTQRNTAALWFSGDFGNLSLDVQGSYTFTLDRYYLFTVDVLDFGGEFLFGGNTPAVLSFDTGRFVFSDFSGKLLDHRADGARVSVGFPRIAVTAQAAFTGLIQVPNSTVILSRSDRADVTASGAVLAAPRLIESLTVELPEIAGRQTITLSALLQQDLRSPGRLASGGGLVHSQYFGIGLDGPIASPLYYEAFFYLNTGWTGTGNILAFLTGAGLDAFFVEALASRIGAEFIYASGDSDYTSMYEGNTAGAGTAFLPISAYTPMLAFTPRLSNIFFGRLLYSFKPFVDSRSEAAQNLQIEVSAAPFFRSVPGPISEGGTAPASTSLYLGTEADLVVRARLLSDLGLGLSFGVFFPGTAITDRAIRVLGRFELSISI